jgi:hypothetical protein
LTRGHLGRRRRAGSRTGTLPRNRLTFTLDGFAPAARDLELRAGDRLRVDLTLSVGARTEETTVVAETPLLETATATRSQVIDKEKVENLPLAGRNPYALAYTISGVTTQFTRPSISARPFDNGGMDAIAINGGRNRSNELLLDGAPNTSREGTSQGSLAFVPSPDAVQEVRVSTNTYDAQFGRTGGGVIAVSIRSGTNAFRGTAYYNHRDASLNSNLYENTVRGIPKEDLFHYNPGFSVGGPVLLPKYNGRNRTFFFYSFEGLKSGIPVSAGERAPTDLERAGDFSQSGMNNLTVADGGNAFASFLLGYMSSNSVTRSPIFDWRSAYSGVFVQDDWRLTSKLTVNLGLRWDYESPIMEQHPTGLLEPAGAANGPATALGTNINYDINDRRIPQFHQWSVGAQYELFWRSVFEVAYIGSATRSIGINRPINNLTADQIALGDAFLNAQVTNPFVGLVPDGGARNTAPTIQRRELMRPRPQFGTINERLVPIGTLDYQAIQLSGAGR